MTQLSLGFNISKRAGDRGLVTMGHEYEMGYGESNGHVTDDVHKLLNSKTGALCAVLQFNKKES